MYSVLRAGRQPVSWGVEGGGENESCSPFPSQPMLTKHVNTDWQRHPLCCLLCLTSLGLSITRS